MAVREYATKQEFLDSPFWDEEQDEPATLTKDLRRASMHIEGLTVTARYYVDDEGMPTDLNLLNAFRDATCAQVAYWHETGDPSGSGEGSVSIGSLSLPGTAGRTSPEAVSILRTAGLVTSAVGH